ncbi:MAG: hypothetical protein WKF67_06905 [Rubrobacteraceae bacterium]
MHNANHEEVEREIRVVLPSGERMSYFPTHMLVSREDDGTLVFIWETKDGRIFNLAINTNNVVAVEMVMGREEQEQEILDLIKQAKAQNG